MRYKKFRGIEASSEALVVQPYHTDSSGKEPRYYQVEAINRVVEAVARGQRRMLLVMATGTGKTYTTFLMRITGDSTEGKADWIISSKGKTLAGLFELPKGWAWVRLDGLALKSEAGWSPKCESMPREGEGWGVLKVSAVTWGHFNPDENKALPSNMKPRPQYEVMPGDFLISRANTSELVARAVIVPKDPPPRLLLSDKTIRFIFSSHASAEFINLANRSPYSREYYAKVAGGTSSSMKNVSREQIRSLVVALPPIHEQHRIVAKVDELMALCDELKARLNAAQTTQIQLADAIVEKAVV
jgi:hypothetical protein